MNKREALEFLYRNSLETWNMISDSFFLTTADRDKILSILRRSKEARDVLAVGITEPEQLSLPFEEVSDVS